MIESIIRRCVSSASFVLATESASLAAARRFATAAAMRIESSWVMMDFGGAGRVTASAFLAVSITGGAGGAMAEAFGAVALGGGGVGGLVTT